MSNNTVLTQVTVTITDLESLVRELEVDVTDTISIRKLIKCNVTSLQIKNSISNFCEKNTRSNLNMNQDQAFSPLPPFNTTYPDSNNYNISLQQNLTSENTLHVTTTDAVHPIIGNVTFIFNEICVTLIGALHFACKL
uniref:Uncharacterized protein n=1 Tax=Rhizophagus irregularis (strain DAOM 181602 / DAOM 197198 / MUCL 43194) TaxID=747089 RepID=U9U6R9_RHIID